MSRGGRRRKSKRPSRAPGAEPQRPLASPNGGRDKGVSQGRRAVSDPPTEPGVEVLEDMQSKPRQLQTLPPDGLVLEELIAVMQGEYGVPSTPQEYRLLVKTATDESVEPPAIEVKPSREISSAGTSRPRTGRRRRRPRHAMGTAVSAEARIEERDETEASGESGIAGGVVPPPPRA
jgi:hypothetical protein